MANLFGLASRCSMLASAMCALLAMLAVPGSAKADDYEDCMAACEQYDHNDPMYLICQGNCTIGATDCKPGNTDCDTYKNKGDCEPGFNNKCNASNVNCGCRWRLVGDPVVDKCVCQNLTGK